MDAAAEDRVIVANPCKRIALPKATAGEVVPPTVEEVERIVEATDSRYRALVILLAGSGLRIGEALGLDVAHVDFLRRTIRVERQLLQGGTFGPPKGRKARTVPVGNVVIGALAAHLAEHPSDEALFTTPTGERLTYRAWRYQWASIVKAVDVDFTTHDLRHFTASALISAGASVKQVQELLGHASAAITLRTYAHLFPGDEDRTRNAMDAVLSSREAVADSLRTEAASD
jgi:integrase